jgi:hypothetical protein
MDEECRNEDGGQLAVPDPGCRRYDLKLDEEGVVLRGNSGAQLIADKKNNVRHLLIGSMFLDALVPWVFGKTRFPLSVVAGSETLSTFYILQDPHQGYSDKDHPCGSARCTLAYTID